MARSATSLPARERAVEAFSGRFGRSLDVVARAPGRVNLIGEHTDYNGGLVLPCAIDRSAVVTLSVREDAVRRFWAADLEVGSESTVERADPAPAATSGFETTGEWYDYPRAVVAALEQRGVDVPGFDLAVASDVPTGSGLSSSAALTVAVCTAVDAALGLGLTARERALVAHHAESDLMGVGCGILDHFASALGELDAALRIDCADRSVSRVGLPPSQLAILVSHSGVTRRLADGEGGYRQRVDECARALSALRDAELVPRDATTLRALDGVALGDLAQALDGPLLRRTRHIATENSRVEGVCAALAREDLDEVGSILKQGQASLRDDYEVSIPELDALCEVADALPGVLGSRLTGAGFGGCALHLVRAVEASAAAEALATGFEARFGRRPPVERMSASAGAEVID